LEETKIVQAESKRKFILQFAEAPGMTVTRGKSRAQSDASQ
jgi:hypothetical protein